MAGSTINKQKIVALEVELLEKETEIARLTGLLASHAPHALTDEIPPPVEEYSPEVAERVEAMGSRGLMETEWLAQMGLSIEDWRDWVGRFPELSRAVSRARARAKAYWDSLARQAMTAGNSRFPIHVYREVKAAQPLTGAGMDDDASSLVIVDVRESASPQG